VTDHFFHRFHHDIEGITIPEKFTFPFYYEPHELSIIAANELQDHLQNQQEWQHNFGLNTSDEGLVIGKMFGVLVVRNDKNEFGYLAAFSGKLAEKNHHKGFVPPVFDMLTNDGFYKKEEDILNIYNKEIEELETSQTFIKLKKTYNTILEESEKEIANQKIYNKKGKEERKQKRIESQKLKDQESFEKLDQELKKISIHESYTLKLLKKEWAEKVKESKTALNEFQDTIKEKKEIRKQKSNALQKKLFNQYYFLNGLGEQKSLLKIFNDLGEKIPPAGAGECAAPKLLHFAFANNLTPITMAEFWWGTPPPSAVRKHRSFYPACRSKCEPILGHMLKGLKVDENPMLINPAIDKKIEIIYEDDFIAVINKPPELLSVPGKNIQDSVYTRMKNKYPDATGPITVHRLDMSTSGIMLITKTKRAHEKLQKQFLAKTIRKRYFALLEKRIKSKTGTIELPLRVDLDNRPSQLVCYEHGKDAKTEYEVFESKKGKTWIYFYPITGRTHQLRVHAAHPNGLNAPILGDDLYGSKGERLHLQAQKIEFAHPITKEKMCFELEKEF
jgi:tRNA pseudouridine32 synthase/23S rRNA pseudouridine746 synthase